MLPVAPILAGVVAGVAADFIYGFVKAPGTAIASALSRPPATPANPDLEAGYQKYRAPDGTFIWVNLSYLRGDANGVFRGWVLFQAGQNGYRWAPNATYKAIDEGTAEINGVRVTATEYGS